MSSPRDQALDVARRTTTFAAERLGPLSARLFQDPASLALVASRLRGGLDLQDAVLATVFEAAATDAGLAGEFLAHFMVDLGGVGQAQVSSDLRRHLDPSDLVQSMIGDLWPDLFALEFRSRREYLAALRQRVRWKASNRRRGLNTARRGEDRRADLPLDEIDPLQSGPSPATKAVMDEASERLVQAVLSLGDRDRRIVRMHLSGASSRAVGEALDLREDAARKAVQRAMERLRGALAGLGETPDP